MACGGLGTRRDEQRTADGRAYMKDRHAHISTGAGSSECSPANKQNGAAASHPNPFGPDALSCFCSPPFSAIQTPDGVCRAPTPLACSQESLRDHASLSPFSGHRTARTRLGAVLSVYSPDELALSMTLVRTIRPQHAQEPPASQEVQKQLVASRMRVYIRVTARLSAISHCTSASLHSTAPRPEVQHTCPLAHICAWNLAQMPRCGPR